ncbi:toxic anion resistance protein [Metabacillus sp. RGM 3146]|uniref:toxic anion resistance protein n=1 Tax=Metabacillus sp. RGM 3146 TaxID=3401092 RepID=UPI003B99A63E
MTGLNKLGETAQEGQQLMEVLSEESRLKAIAFASEMDPHDHHALLTFGAEAQKRLSAFANRMLDQVRKKDIGDAGRVISALMSKLQELDPEELKQKKASFFTRLFGKGPRSTQEVISRFQQAGAQIDRMGIKLEMSKAVLLSDIEVLENLYTANQEYFHELNVYISAGEWKLKELYENQHSEKSRQAAENLEMRLYDLKVSREITRQSAPQIRMIQRSNHILAEKIQSSIMTLIPLWKNQVTIALTVVRQKHAIEMQDKTAKASEVFADKNKKILQIEGSSQSVETLKKTQLDLLSTLEETLYIQKEGSENREKAEQELSFTEKKS